MARVENWQAKEVFDNIETTAFANANAFMDKIVKVARDRCPPPGKTNITRRWGGFRKAHVEFVPKTDNPKGRLVKFDTDKRWVDRTPGDLKATVRRTNHTKRGRGTNVRVYAGNFKIYWAFMVEYGTVSTGWGGPAAATPFMRQTWNENVGNVANAIKYGQI